MQLQPKRKPANLAPVSGSSVQAPDPQLNDISLDQAWKVSKRVKDKIRKNKARQKAAGEALLHLRQYSKLNQQLLGKISEVEKEINPVPSKQKTPKSELKRIEKEQIERREQLEYMRFLRTKDSDFMNGRKRGFPVQDNNEVNSTLKRELNKRADKQDTYLKVLLTRSRAFYQDQYNVIKDAITKPDVLLRLREYSRYELKQRLKMYSTILTAFDVLLNLTVGFQVTRPNFKEHGHGYNDYYTPALLHDKSYWVSSEKECSTLRKKQGVYYRMLHEKKSKDDRGYLHRNLIDFRNVSKYKDEIFRA